MVLSARFSEACSLAASLHRNQLRKGPRRIPYMSHLLAVTAIVLEHGGTEEEAIAALLHDAVEDQGGAATLAVIRRIFGPDVAAIVEGCSDTDEQPKPPWRARKERYLAHLAEASPSVLLVSTADKLANARTVLEDYREIGEDLWSRFNGTRDETLWYYRSVVEILQTRPAPPQMVAELARVVAEIEKLVAATSGLETGSAPAR
jgi:(p)ppGpp synthase/HD superfamily hydrolase